MFRKDFPPQQALEISSISNAAKASGAGASAIVGSVITLGPECLVLGAGLFRGLTTPKKGTETTDVPNTGLPDDAIVCREGSCTADRFTSGSGVTTDADGKLVGVSVNSAPGKSWQDLTQGNPLNNVGVTIGGDVRRAGGDISSPTRNNPNHATMSGLIAKQAENLMTPTVRNPSR